MFFYEINPFVRYIRNLNLIKDSYFEEVVALDARLFYCIGGYGKIVIENTEYLMSPHSLIIINSGVPYKILPPEKHADYIAVNFDFTQNANKHGNPVSPVIKTIFKKEMLLDCNTFEDAKELSKVFYIKEIPVISKDLKTISDEHMQKLLYYELRSGHILAKILTESLRFSKLCNITSKKDNATSMLCFIHENYQKNLTYQSLGNQFGYHPNYMSFMIKKLTGMTLHRYLTHVRLTNAAYLLENTSLSCNEIAETCGFVDSSHFSRCFKNHFGTSPSGHRNI